MAAAAVGLAVEVEAGLCFIEWDELDLWLEIIQWLEHAKTGVNGDDWYFDGFFIIPGKKRCCMVYRNREQIVHCLIESNFYEKGHWPTWPTNGINTINK